MKLAWPDIMVMPYPFFNTMLKWKYDYEENKNKKMNEKMIEMRNKNKAAARKKTK